ncbi:MAG: hypothetical protein Q9M16_03935 [Mariprofundus sp.]|nr:hypothetical protein [Mariprofundus sp.]
MLRLCFSPVRIRLGRDSESSKHIIFRLWMLLLLMLAVIFAAAVAGSILMPPPHSAQHKQYIAQLQYEQRNLTHKLSETEAMLALRDAQIESMQAESLRNTHAMRAMHKRLAMFDDVLAARKVSGWHILHAMAEWLDDHTIAYSLVVVKGENYPRWAKGHISFSVLDSNGTLIGLDNKAGKRSLQFDVTTHKFFEGQIAWTKNWRAKMLMISLFDKRGKNNQQIEIPIVNKYKLSTHEVEHRALKYSPRISDAAQQQ